MNHFVLSGIIGRIEERNGAVFSRVCHKDRYYDEKKKEVIEDQNWFTVALFGRKGEAFIRDACVGDVAIFTGSLNTHPKEGPESRLRLNAGSFYILLPPSMKGSKKAKHLEPDYEE